MITFTDSQLERFSGENLFEIADILKTCITKSLEVTDKIYNQFTEAEGFEFLKDRIARKGYSCARESG